MSPGLHGIFDSQSPTAATTPRHSSPPSLSYAGAQEDLEEGRTTNWHDRQLSAATAVELEQEVQEIRQVKIDGTTRSRGTSSSLEKESALDVTPPRSSSLRSAGDLDDGLDKDTRRFNSLLIRIAARRPKLGRVLLWLRGPSPPINERSLKPFLPKTEDFFSYHLQPLTSRRRIITPLFLLVWIVGFTLLVRHSFFNSTTNVGTPTFIVADTSYWYKDDQCGLNGTSCTPFDDYSFVFRCPSQTLNVELLNNREVGAEQLIYRPLVVGGMDALGTYRGDSWICAAAIHRGLFGDKKGGCGEVELVGEFTGYEGGSRNGVDSVGFASTFPSSFRFIEGVDQGGCRDLRDEILGFNVAMSTVFSFIIR